MLSVSFLAAGFFLVPQTPAQMPIRGIYSAVTLPYLMDVFMLVGSVQQADEPNDLAQGQTPL